MRGGGEEAIVRGVPTVDVGMRNPAKNAELVAVLAQRLARKLCSNCCEMYTPTTEELMTARISPDMAAAREGMVLYRKVGCPRCNRTGYKGRVGIFQLLIMNDELEALASADAEEQRIKDTTLSPAGGPESYNWSYSWAGDQRSKPVRIFDDGKFTYLQFADGQPLPAIFAVDENGEESLVNSHQRGQFTVVERREAQFSLRDGKFVTCIFDDTAAAPLKNRNYRRRKPL